MEAYSHQDPDTGRRNRFVMRGTDQEIWEELCHINGEIPAMQNRVGASIQLLKRSVAPYQAAALYTLCKSYHGTGSLGGRVLELGTFIGYTAAWMACAMPDKKIVTLNPKEHEFDQAKANLKPWKGVIPLCKYSWDYLEEHDSEGSPKYDVIFVDGDHARVRLDLPWLTHLLPGGLMIFHDYSPADSGRACPPVFEAINELAAKLRPETGEPDVLIIDQHKIGLAGFYKRPTDHIGTIDPIVVKEHPITIAAADRAAAARAALATADISPHQTQ